MSHVTYTIVEHDGGWAYKVGDVFSETFATREAAQSGEIEYEDSSGRWHDEDESGEDRPETEVKD